MPAALCPDVSDDAAPDLIGRIDHELPVEPIRDVDPFDRGLLVGMTTGLLADQSLLLHQASDLEAANHRALLAHHAHDAAATC